MRAPSLMSRAMAEFALGDPLRIEPPPLALSASSPWPRLMHLSSKRGKSLRVRVNR